jgi:galactokinase
MTVTVPGRANLIGEHIDYHGLPVLPIALRRSIRLDFEPRDDDQIVATSAQYGARSFRWTPHLTPVAAGDWENYLRAAAEAVAGKWGAGRGIDAVVKSDLAPAAGLSSSSALMIAFTLALHRANQVEATFDELMEILPEGEQFVGTRGGAMDHAAILGSRAGYASLISFDPVRIRHVAIPAEWIFLVVDSGQRAEKSGAIRERYNAIRTGVKQEIFDHVTTEASRVQDAVHALEQNDPQGFGKLLLEGHASLRDRLQVSTPALDRIVEAAMKSGALGARLTGAGFGGCAVVLCLRSDVEKVRAGLHTVPIIDAVHS